MAAVALFVLACSKDKSTTPSGDTTPPAAITDLACTDSSGDSITLRWTAPGDDGASGHAARYDLRYWRRRLTSADWDSASSVTLTLTPRPAGSIESLTLHNRTWWTTYYFALETVDSAGNWSDVSNTATATVFPDSALRFLIQTQSGVYICDPNRHVTRFADPTGEIEIIGDRLFAIGDGRKIYGLDAAGAPVDSIPTSESGDAVGFVALPNDRFALLDNMQDLAYILGRSGQILATFSLRDHASDARQNVSGVVVGNALVISENGSGGILRVDVASYAIDDLKNLNVLGTPPGDIDYDCGRYYVCTSHEVYSFTDSTDAALVGTLDQAPITAIAVAGGYSFVTVEESGMVYALNHSTRTAAVFISGLNHPRDIEILHR
ncbi:MAG: hypothetical protein AB1792_03975 [Candidatus Zixiibacteriota bacterium]